MIIHSIRLAALIASMLVLTSCGGGSSAESSSLSIRLTDCKSYNVRDNGELIYIVVSTDCAGQSQTVEFESMGIVSIKTIPINSHIYFTQSPHTRRVEIVSENTWRVIENDNSWTARDGAGLEFLNGYLYLLGGWNYTTATNEVWRTKNLVDWEQLPDAPWEARHGAGWVVHDNKLWVVGGDLIDDVWFSSDGITWVMALSSAPFGKRYTPSAVSFGGFIYLYGGQYWSPVDWCNSRPDCLPVGLNDVWRSKNGVDWEKIQPNAPWSGRSLVHGGLYFNNEIFVVGGGLKNAVERYSETYSEFGDIWSSSDGVNWTKRLDAFSFLPRTHFSVLATASGCYVSDGSVGVQSNVSNDLFFAKNCIDYIQLETPKEMKKRHASSLFEFNGSIVILGGPPADQPGTAIWQYFPSLVK